MGQRQGCLNKALLYFILVRTGEPLKENSFESLYPRPKKITYCVQLFSGFCLHYQGHTALVFIQQLIPVQKSDWLFTVCVFMFSVALLRVTLLCQYRWRQVTSESIESFSQLICSEKQIHWSKQLTVKSVVELFIQMIHSNSDSLFYIYLSSQWKGPQRTSVLILNGINHKIKDCTLSLTYPYLL